MVLILCLLSPRIFLIPIINEEMQMLIYHLAVVDLYCMIIHLPLIYQFASVTPLFHILYHYHY